MSVAALALLLIAADPAPPAYAWPCPGPAPAPIAAPAAIDWRDDAAVAALVADVAPRRVAEADAVARIRTARVDQARLVAGLTDVIGREQRSILAGIRRFNTRQALLARRIEAGYAAADAAPVTASTLQSAAADTATWDVRIFEDRQRMLPIICRLPGVLDTRLKALTAAARGG